MRLPDLPPNSSTPFTDNTWQSWFRQMWVATTGGLGIQTASQALGTAVLVAGTKVVTNPKITANTLILMSVKTASGTQGFLSNPARVVGTSFTITSSSATDTSTVAWMLVEPL